MTLAQVLDHGYIELVDRMGDDARVIEAANVCTSRSTPPEQHERLIRRLVELGHNTPLEFVGLTWRVKCPIFVARQWMRHRIGSFCELSLRYNEAQLEYYTPDNLSLSAKRYWHTDMKSQFSSYVRLLSQGVRREQARGVLGTAIYTEFMWSVNFWSFANWYRKRCAPAAQWEHRQYADAAADLLEPRLPLCMAALKESMA